MADKFELFEVGERVLVVPAEANTQEYQRAKMEAKERGMTLTFAPPKPKPWEPPADAVCVPHDVTSEEYRAAVAEATEKGLEGGVVVAPKTWSGERIRLGTKKDDVWEPPPNSIVISQEVSHDDYMRAKKTAQRLGVELVVAPSGTPLPEHLPENIKPGLPVAIPHDATPQEYKKLKALAESRKVPYFITTKGA